jgi:carbamoyl-phosphate synthase large subunit
LAAGILAGAEGMSIHRTTVVLTGIGLDGGPDIIRALRADPAISVRVVGVDASAEQPSRYLCDGFHVVPPRDDPSYVESVARVAAGEGARVIYPLPAHDQEIFARARANLAGEGFAVPVSPVESVRICDDKWLLYERLRETLPAVVPATQPVHSIEELAETAARFGYPEQRVCIRRKVSRGAIGLRVLDAGAARLSALLDENPGSLLMSLDEAIDVLAQAGSFPTYLVQEYLPGDEWDVDVLCRDGEAVVVATRHNLEMMGAGAMRSALEPSETLASLATEIIGELGLNAVVNFAFRSDRRGDPKLLEINPRIPSSILCAMAGGLNLVSLAVRQALGERLEAAEPEWGGQFLRHFQSVMVDESGAVVDIPAALPEKVVRR